MRNALYILAILLLLSGCLSAEIAEAKKPGGEPSEVWVTVIPKTIQARWLRLYLPMLLPDFKAQSEGPLGSAWATSFSMRVICEHAKNVVEEVSNFLDKHAAKHDVDSARKPFKKWSSNEMFSFFLQGFGCYPVTDKELGPQYDYVGLLEIIVSRKDAPEILPYCQILLAYLLENRGAGAVCPPPENPGEDALLALYRDVANNQDAPGFLRATAFSYQFYRARTEKERREIAQKIVSQFTAFRSWAFYRDAEDIVAK